MYINTALVLEWAGALMRIPEADNKMDIHLCSLQTYSVPLVIFSYLYIPGLKSCGYNDEHYL